jgi:hypothetical protein
MHVHTDVTRGKRQVGSPEAVVLQPPGPAQMRAGAWEPAELGAGGTGKTKGKDLAAHSLGLDVVERSQEGE